MNLSTDPIPAGPPAENPTPKSETILVVDDQPALCEVADILFTHCGYRTLIAYDGFQAREIARQHPEIDLLLTDIEMPGMLGDELAVWFRNTNPQAAVIFMSGNPMQRRRLQEFPFIEKPFVHLDALVATIREALDRTRPARAAAAAAPRLNKVA